MTCKKCGSENVAVQAVTEVKSKRRGVAGRIIWWMIVIFTCGIALMFMPRIRCHGDKVRSATHSEAVCQNCGYRWKV